MGPVELARRIEEVAARHGLDAEVVSELTEAASGQLRVEPQRPPSAGSTSAGSFGTWGGQTYDALDAGAAFTHEEAEAQRDAAAGDVAARDAAAGDAAAGDAATGDAATGAGLDWSELPAAAPAAPSVLPLSQSLSVAERYQDLGPIGAGGMGEVRRVWDRLLERPMAMKLLRPELLGRDRAVDRFLREAQVTAQLQHPAIVPVADLGRLPDGRVFFTMKEVRGRTLSEAIREVHASSTPERWVPAPSGWTFRRLIDALRRVSEAVAFAHAHDVLHRDLKPANIMVGEYGEVLLLDWGLARAQGPIDAPAGLATESGSAKLTRSGAVAGTPAYMPPEQASGDAPRVGPPADVYALGATLYEVLSGAAPFEGSGQSALAALLQAPPPPVSERAAGGPPLPEELVAICERAMARDPDARFPHGGALAEELTAWLEGARKRERALAVVDEARVLLPEVKRLRAQAGSLRAQAAAHLASVAYHQPVADKLEAWGAEDQATDAEWEADRAEIRMTQLLRAALTEVPELPEAHGLLAEHYHRQHSEAEAGRDRAAARRFELLLRDHDRGRFADYLRGEGALTLLTEPPGAGVRMHRFVEQERRMVPVFERSLGTTPLIEIALPMGSYLLELNAPGRETVRYPVYIRRQEHWDGVRPGDPAPAPITLPRVGELAPDEIYVPAGWSLCGHPEALNSLPPQRIWVDAVVVGRFPVTNRAYIEFLDDLVAQGREPEALEYVPRERAARPGERGAMCYGRGADGRFFLAPDADGDMWDPEWPVFNVTWHGAMAWCAWRHEEGRLPSELEWEKAARGVDGRLYPFGDQVDATWANTKWTREAGPLPAVVDSFPVDMSPYGLRGVAGNAADWCVDEHRREGPEVDADGVLHVRVGGSPDSQRALRGGTWSYPTRWCAVSTRQAFPAQQGITHYGFRFARPLPS